MICPFCNYNHNNEGDRYGCPDCLGEGLEENDMTAKTNAERQADRRRKMRDSGVVEVLVQVPKDRAEEIKRIAREMLQTPAT